MHVVGHVLVDVVGQLDEAERVAEVLLDPPREVARVDRQAVPADSGAGRESHVAERFGRRGVDRPPDVDAEVAGEHRQLVDERDVDVPERVLEQLDELGLLARTDGNGLVDERVEERLHRLQRGLVGAAHDLGRVDEPVRRVAGVDSFGRVAEVVVAAQQARRLLEDRGEELGRRSRIGGALEDHARPRSQESAE